MSLTTRKPTGKPSWPIVLLAGREKAGKSWAAIAASASPLIGRTIYLGMGENDPDEYALIPGADFDIAEHAGTFESFLQTVRDAVAEPPVDGKPTLLIVDSATRLWNLLGDNVQAVANKRAKGARNALTADYTVSPDLWNAAANQWQDVMDALRAHQGPVIITARLDLVMVMEGGKPSMSGAKEWKVQGHKSLPFDCDVVLEMHERGSFLMTGARSARIQLPKPRLVPDFTIEWLWEQLGVAGGTGERAHATVVSDTAGLPAPKLPAAERIAKAEAAVRAAADRASLDRVWDDVKRSGLDGTAPLKAAFAEMDGKFPASTIDAWETKAVPA